MRQIFLAIIVLMAICVTASGAILVVAPGGRDTSPGTAQQPLASLEAARDAARTTPGGPHQIVLMPGAYYLNNTLELDPRDNGLTILAHDAGKTAIYGGLVVAGWRRDGDRFWTADLPPAAADGRDARVLIVDGQLAERARLPESGTYRHRSAWTGARYISGSWDPKPSLEQSTTIVYDPQDLPATLDVSSAEIRVYHMWNESLYGIARNDVARHALLLASPTIHPPGAFGVQKYVLFNTRAGMTRPGQWYLDRAAGRIVYWPLAGQDMARVRAIVPRLECLIRATGNVKRTVEGITVRGLALQATTVPLGARQFGATGYGGAVHFERSRQCTLEKLEIANVGGQAIVFRGRNEAIRIVDCHVHHTGACGVEVTVTGPGSLVARNHIHHVGQLYPSAISLSANGDGLHIHRNEIHDGPYSGIVSNPASDYRIEENLVYRVMREMQDGAAIYGHFTRSVIRGNLVRDVVSSGPGYGVYAYYLDEQSCDCLVERNVSIGAENPLLSHISRQLTIRDNVFIADKNMGLAFARSAGCTLQGNTLFVPGQLKVVQPNAITAFKGNVVFRDAIDKDGTVRRFTIGDSLPPAPRPGRRTGPSFVVRVAQPPVLDGAVGADEWPGASLELDREPSRWPASGVPVGAELCYDDRCLYLAVIAGFYQIAKLRQGPAWGQDDGMEISLAGRTSDGKAVTFVVRGFADGKLQSVTDAGAPVDAAQRLGQSLRFATGRWVHGWRGEFAIPWDALGLKPTPGLRMAFNLAVYRSEDQVWRCREGTLAETWRLDQAAAMQLR